MWEVHEPARVKLIVGILASDSSCLDVAVRRVAHALGPVDLASEVWPFTQTHYYDQQTGPHIRRQFVSLSSLIHPGELAHIKHRTNALEQALAESLDADVPRPVNLDPGVVEPSKLVLASTKNFSHRIYIGENIYAEITLIFDKGQWRPMPHTYPDYRQSCYFAFFDQVRQRLREQLKKVPN